MSGKKHEDYVHSLATKNNTEDGLGQMLGGLAGAIQGTQAAGGPAQSRQQQKVEIFSNVDLYETKIVDQVLIMEYQIHNRGQQPVRVTFDFAGSQNMNIVSPKESVGKMTSEVYIGVGERADGPTLRQHIRTMTSGVQVRTEVKVCEKEWGNTTDNIVYRQTPAASSAAAPAPLSADDERRLREIDSSLDRARQALRANDVSEARNAINEADTHLSVLRRSTAASQLNARISLHNTLSREVRDAEARLAGGSGAPIHIDVSGNSDHLIHSIRRSLDSVAARVNELSPLDAPNEASSIMAELNSVKPQLTAAQVAGASSDQLRDLVQRYNKMARDVPTTINGLIARAPRQEASTTTTVVGERKGFTVNPVTGKKQYTTNR